LMGRMLTLPFFGKARDPSVTLLPPYFTQDFVEKFCNGSIRRLLRLLKRLVASYPMQWSAEQQEQREGKLVPHYVFMNAVLTGGRDYFDENDEDNDFVNVYKATDDEPSPYALMIGIHLLHLLSQGQHFRVSELIAPLAQIGYRQQEVDGCLAALRQRGCFKCQVADHKSDYDVFVESDIVEAYLTLAQDPAYVDNMALVTPVEEDLFARGKMRHTVSYAIGEFKQRVSTTLQFIRQIRSDENYVRTWRRGSARHRMKSDVFEEKFNMLNLPSIYRRIAVAYRARLQGLKENPMNLAGVMTARDWDQLLVHNELLRVEQSEVDIPLKAIGGTDKAQQTTDVER
jgi:hypothetical protein